MYKRNFHFKNMIIAIPHNVTKYFTLGTVIQFARTKHAPLKSRIFVDVNSFLFSAAFYMYCR